MARAKRIGAPAGPRAENARETRRRILEAGIEQFAERGFSDATIGAICGLADVNPRMVYHYFKDKAGLYVAVLEQVLGDLRTEELKLDVSTSDPMEGLLTMFDFTFDHFSGHPELIRLLSAENLMQAAFLKESETTPIVALPLIAHLRELLTRGEASGEVRAGVDPLHLYVLMVALSYFHKSNAYTLAIIFGPTIMETHWQNEHHAIARELLAAYLRPAA